MEPFNQDVFTLSYINGKKEDAINFSFTFAHPYNIYNLHDICRKFAIICGYSEAEIDEAFGRVQTDKLL